MPAGQDQDPPAGADAPERERGGAIRVWAKDHGIAVSDRGRIPGSEVERYQAADPALATTLARGSPGRGPQPGWPRRERPRLRRRRPGAY